MREQRPGPGEDLQAAFESPEQVGLVRDQLNRILESPGFVHSERMRQFLQFVVERALEGEAQRLKESVIGVEVFKRTPGYDPKLEPIVRIEARRLREKLQEYYEKQGSAAPVVIHLPKGGYVPAFEVRQAEAATPLPQAIPVAPPPPPANRRVFWPALGLGLCLVGVAVGALWRGAPRGRISLPTLSPLTSLPGRALRPAISPDGKRVAFAWDGGTDSFRIYVKRIGAEDPVRLTAGRDTETDPAWSPDGRQIAFLRIGPDRGDVVVAPSGGGPERTLASLAALQVRRPNRIERARGLGPVWSPDGRSIAVADFGTAEEPGGIYLIAVDTGEKRRVTLPSRRDEADSDPVISPQGDRLALVRWRAGASGSGDLYVQSLKGGEPKQLTFDHRQISGLTWTPDGKQIIFASDRNGDFGLWRIGTGGGTPAPVSGERGVHHPSESADGKRLAFTEELYSTGIVRVPLTPDAPAQPAPFSSSSRRDDSPVYSPDGKRVAFISNRSGPVEIWVAGADGSNAAPLANLKDFLPGTPRWSPNSVDLAFDSRHEGFGAVYVVSANGGRPRRLTRESSNSMMPSWSSDGRSVYFASDRSGSWQVWRQAVDGAEAVQITRNGGREARETADGKYIYYGGLGPRGLWRVPVGGGEETPVPEFANVTHSRYWTVAERGIYYLSGDRAPWVVSFFDFATRHSSPVFTSTSKPIVGTPGLSVSPDGRYLLFAEINREGSDILLMEHFE